MWSKRKLPMLLILVFIMMFLILITTSYAQNLENIDILTFDNENVINSSRRDFYLVVIARLGIVIAQILLIINVLLLIFKL